MSLRNRKENSVARLDDQRGKLEDMRSNMKTDQTVKGLGKFAFPSESKGEQTQKEEQTRNHGDGVSI